MTKCGSCGLELPEEKGNANERDPCPSCGSTTRQFDQTIEETVRVSDNFMMEVQHEGRTVGFRESAREGRAASGDDHGDGTLSLTLTGTSPQGEEDTASACRVLVRAMNGKGDTWNAPAAGTGDVDCVATNAADEKAAPLNIQVVRAIVDPEMWHSLAARGMLEKPKVEAEKIADLIADALGKKLDPRKIPLPQRPALVLALDATRLPALAFDAVIDSFRERHGALVRGAGFRSVWLVGPSESLTKRLDLD